MNPYATHIIKSKRQQGFTLVEIMIAIALSIILLTGVLQIFASSKSTYRVQENLARMQENGRFALDFLTRDIRMAGYSGCSSFGPVTNTLNSSADLLFNFSVGLEGFNDVGGTPPTYLSAAGITPDANTDVVIVRRVSDNPVRLVKNNSSSQLFIESTTVEPNACLDGGGNVSDKISGLCETDILLVSDCQKSRIFQAANLTVTGQELNVTHPASGSPGNAITSWGGASAPPEEQFNEDAEIVRIEVYAYFISTRLDGVPVLNQLKDGVISELVEGVEDMQVQYGEDTTGDRTANVYRDADAVADWSQVVSTKLHFLVRTVDNNLASDPQDYNFNGTTVSGASLPTDDRHLRREFTSTITLRNRAS